MQLQNAQYSHHIPTETPTELPAEIRRGKCPDYHNATATTTMFPPTLRGHSYNYHMTTIRETATLTPCDISKHTQRRNKHDDMGKS